MVGMRVEECATFLKGIIDADPGSELNVSAVSGVEQALWDLRGRIAGQPVCSLFGDVLRRDIAVYANINRATVDRTAEEFACIAADAVAAGHQAIKLAPFDGFPDTIDCADDARKGIDVVRAVREAIGPEAILMVDCHSHFTARGALEVADRMVELGVSWFEQPVPDEDVEGCLEVNRRCPITVAGGEEHYPASAFEAIFKDRTMEIVMPDVSVVGGLAELHTIAERACQCGMPVSPHGPYGPVVLLAGAHVMAVCPGFKVLEYAWGEVDWRSELTLPYEDIRNGVLHLPEGPGFGVTLTPDIVARYRVCL
jgi:galactonate dehydratase